MTDNIVLEYSFEEIIKYTGDFMTDTAISSIKLIGLGILSLSALYILYKAFS